MELKPSKINIWVNLDDYCPFNCFNCIKPEDLKPITNRVYKLLSDVDVQNLLLDVGSGEPFAKKETIEKIFNLNKQVNINTTGLFNTDLLLRSFENSYLNNMRVSILGDPLKEQKIRNTKFEINREWLYDLNYDDIQNKLHLIYVLYRNSIYMDDLNYINMMYPHFKKCWMFDCYVDDFDILEFKDLMSVDNLYFPLKGTETITFFLHDDYISYYECGIFKSFYITDLNFLENMLKKIDFYNNSIYNAKKNCNLFKDDKNSDYDGCGLCTQFDKIHKNMEFCANHWRVYKQFYEHSRTKNKI